MFRRSKFTFVTYASRSVYIMGTPAGPVKISVGDKIKDQFIVKKKIGEGACGMVYLVQHQHKHRNLAAMKVEPLMKNKDDEILKMDVYVLKKMQFSAHVCRFLGAGKAPSYTFLIMTLLGKELSEIRRRLPSRKMNAASVLRISIQTFKALEDMHSVGFVHRDVKPSNLAMGAPPKKNVVVLFDFGLARQIMIPDANGKLQLREARTKVMFRGTVRYCSLNVHLYKEQGRHDDLYGVLYSMIELHTGHLPWKGMVRKEAARLKETTTDAQLCKGCPPSFQEIAKILSRLTYKDTPPYQQIQNLIASELKKNKISLTEAWEWDAIPGCGIVEEKAESRKRKDAPEIDKNSNDDDRRTSQDVEESVVTESKDEAEDLQGFAAEDTLEILGKEK